MLIFFTIIILLLILAGAVGFPYVPMLFGVYDSTRKEARGKLIVSLLLLAPFFALLCLAIAWSGAGVVRYAALLPVLYLLCLWLIRPNKWYGSGPQKRFAIKQQNIDEQEREQEYKWLFWFEKNNAKVYLCFTFWSPNKLQASTLR